MRSVENKFRIASFPKDTNPYVELFYAALKPYGVQHVGEIQFTQRWIHENVQSIDGIHIHWPESIWRSGSDGSLDQLWKVGCLSWFLRHSQKVGLRNIWTLHNVEPHEGANWVDGLGCRVICRASDLVICHSVGAAEWVQRQYPCGGHVVIMPHGNYASVYPEPRAREYVLKELGLRTDLPMVCCVGGLRNYKGFDVACEAIADMGGAVQLIIAGRVHEKYDVQALHKSVEGLSGGLLLPRKLSGQEFADVISASDAVLLPYRNVTSSGVLLAAWTLGRGVIASNLSYFREMVPSDSDAGMLFPVGNARALTRAIKEYLLVPADRRTEAALRVSRKYSWDRCIKAILPVLTEWTRDV